MVNGICSTVTRTCSIMSLIEDDLPATCLRDETVKQVRNAARAGQIAVSGSALLIDGPWSRRAGRRCIARAKQVL